MQIYFFVQNLIGMEFIICLKHLSFYVLHYISYNYCSNFI